MSYLERVLSSFKAKMNHKPTKQLDWDSTLGLPPQNLWRWIPSVVMFQVVFGASTGIYIGYKML